MAQHTPQWKLDMARLKEENEKLRAENDSLRSDVERLKLWVAAVARIKTEA